MKLARCAVAVVKNVGLNEGFEVWCLRIWLSLKVSQLHNRRGVPYVAL